MFREIIRGRCDTLVDLAIVFFSIKTTIEISDDQITIGVHMPMQDYKSPRVTDLKIWASLVKRHTHTNTQTASDQLHYKPAN